MKNLACSLALSLLFVGFVACDDDDDDPVNPTILNFTAALSGANEVPANPSTATGNAAAVYNDDTNKLSVTVTYTGLTPTDAHIHEGGAGVSGPVVFPFTDLTSPIMLTNVTLTAEQESDLKNDLYYVNLHTAAYPDGEIRGQLIEQ